MNNNDELFNDIFEVLESSIANDNSNMNNLIDSDNVSTISSSSSSILRGNCYRWKLNQTSEYMNRIRSIRSRNREKFRSVIDTQSKCNKSIQDLNELSQLKVIQHRLVSTRQLREQQRNSERRMRELIYEIIGEYGKSNLRINRRFTYLWHANRIQVNWNIWNQRWKRYLLKLKDEVIKGDDFILSYDSLNTNILYPKNDKIEIQTVLRKLINYNKTYSGLNINTCTIIRFQNQFHTNQAIPLQNNEPLIMTNSNELHLIAQELQNWLYKTTKSGHINRNQNINNNNNSMPKPPQLFKKDELKNNSQLCKLLSSKSIEWLQPASSNPLLWDNFAKRILSPNDYDSKYNSSAMPISPRSPRNNSESFDNSDSQVYESSSEIDDFTAKYATQHCAFSASDHLYFCLEERIAAISEHSSFPSNQNTANNDLAIEILDELQKLYVGISTNSSNGRKKSSNKSTTFLTATPNTNTIENNGIMLGSGGSVEELRNDLNNGNVDVIENVSSHRYSKNQNNVISNYPDVIKAKLSSGREVHFVVAIKYNLIETYAFSNISLSADELREVSQNCPHPFMTYLISSKFPPIHTFYTPTWTLPIDGLNMKNATMVGLSQICMRELLRIELWSDKSYQQQLSLLNENINDSSSMPLPPPNDGNNLETFSTIPTKALSVSLLPDHTRTVISCAENETSLYHDYILIKCDTNDTRSSYNINNDNEQDKKSKSRLTKNNSNNNEHNNSPTTKSAKPNYYLLQVPAKEPRLQNEKYNKDQIIFQGIFEAYNQSTNTNLFGNNKMVNIDENDPSIKKWDSTVLSNVCRWRACLCDATSEPAPKYLCAYHTVLKSYLDNKTGTQKNSESAKYLPRKVPPIVPYNEPDRDLLLIRSASTLLQELWDGKLKGTLKSFAKKVCEELGIRRRLSVIISREKDKSNKLRNNDIILSNPKFMKSHLNGPSWSKWKDKTKLDAIFQTFDTAAEYFHHILEIEKAITDEVKFFENVGVYPSAELAIIRKDVKNFRESQSSEIDDDKSKYNWLDEESIASELRMSEKKFDLLQRRRQDDDVARANIQRKEKRVKALEEMQAKDPYNFGFSKNQSRFS